MSQNIYSIQLLNDLHNHFPELLYNTRRFQNVQDVLFYIRSVADMSPLERGQSLYNYGQHQVPQQPVRQYGIGSQVAPPPPPPPPIPSTGLYNTIPIHNSTIPQAYVTTVFEDNIPTTRVRMSMNNNTNALINTLLGGLFGDILGGGGMGGVNLDAFLNQRVAVYPTNEEIENASRTVLITRNQDDICAICQENFEEGQYVRHITHCNHSFHRDCIDTWFRGNVHCPTCRHDIREVEVNSQINRNNNNRTNSNPPPVPENHRRMNIRRSEDE
jgi:hypothetical protein